MNNLEAFLEGSTELPWRTIGGHAFAADNPVTKQHLSIRRKEISAPMFGFFTGKDYEYELVISEGDKDKIYTYINQGDFSKTVDGLLKDLFVVAQRKGIEDLITVHEVKF